MATIEYFQGVDDFLSSYLVRMTPSGRTATTYTYTSPSGHTLELGGVGFTYDGNNVPTGGTVLTFTVRHPDGTVMARSDDVASAPLATVHDFVGSQLLNALFPSADIHQGSDLQDEIYAGGAGDVVYGNGGADTLTGGTDVTLVGGAGNDTFRVGGTNDTVSIHGGSENGWAESGERNSLRVGDGGVTTLKSVTNLNSITFEAAFGPPGTPTLSTLVLSTDQIGSGKIASDLNVDVSGQIAPRSFIALKFVRPGVGDVDLDLSGLTGTFLTGSSLTRFLVIDLVAGSDSRYTTRVIGSRHGETISTDLGSDTVRGGGGVDRVSLGRNDDTYLIGANEWLAGESVNGGDGVDTLVVDGAAVDLTTGTVAEFERLSLRGGAQVTMSLAQAQSGWTFVGGAGANAVDIGLANSAALTLSGLRQETWDSDDTLNLNLAGDATFHVGSGGSAVRLALVGNNLANVATIRVSGGAFDMAGWDLGGWEAQDAIDIIGSDGGNERIGIGTHSVRSIDGGEGYDTLVFDRHLATQGILFDLSAQTLSLPGEAMELLGLDALEGRFGSGDDTVVGGVGRGGNTVDDVVFLGDGADLFSGRGGHDIVSGEGGNDTLTGGTGADELLGGSGDDVLRSLVGESFAGGTEVLDGGADIDLAVIDRSDRVRSLTLDLSDPSERSGLGDGTTLVRVERVEFRSGAGNDLLTGGALADTILGAAGRDVIDGGGGADSLEGGAGVDLLIGGSGGDSLDGGEDSDSLHGESGDDRLRGGLGNDNLEGDAGNDTLDGGSGFDRLIGGVGDDTYVLSSGDTVLEEAGEGTDTILVAGSFSLAALAQIENLAAANPAGTTALSLTGNTLRNALTGNAGANIFNGGLGSDTFTGGGGVDTFLFTTKAGSTNLETITDFRADDFIKLENAVFTKLAKTGTLSATAFRLGTRALDGDDRVIYDKATGSLWYDADGSGRVAAVKFAILTASPTISYKDVLVI